MRTIYLVTLSVLALMLAMCSGCDEREESGGEFRIEFRSCVLTPRPDDATKYQARVILRIHNASVAQDVYTQGALRWQEHIALFGGNTWNDDHHVVYQGESRRVRSRPAKVEGVTADQYGTSMLWIYPGLEVGEPYFQRPIGGTIVSQDWSREIEFSIECMDDGVRVTINGYERFVAK